MRFAVSSIFTARRHALAAALALPLAAALVGCADAPPPMVHHYAPPTYAYLTKLRLNVSTIEIENRIPPASPQDEAQLAPTPPDQALEQMARDRLVAAGSGGKAVFSIDGADLLRADDGSLSGQMAVHVDIFRADGSPGGYLAARVARSHTPGTDDEDAQQVRHDLVTQMMAAMNVELEFQIRRNLRDWLLRDAPVAQSVTSEPLAPPPATVPPPAAGAESPEIPAQMSPPPGVLHLPGQ